MILKYLIQDREFTVVTQRTETGWWVGMVQELPGCGSQGANFDEFDEMIRDAICQYLAAQGAGN